MAKKPHPEPIYVEDIICGRCEHSCKIRLWHQGDEDYVVRRLHLLLRHALRECATCKHTDEGLRKLLAEDDKPK